MVDICSKEFDEEEWLVYQQAVPQNDEHVKHETSCTTWCIDFDGTITNSMNETNRNLGQELLRFAMKPDLDFERLTTQLSLTAEELQTLLSDDVC